MVPRGGEKEVGVCGVELELVDCVPVPHKVPDAGHARRAEQSETMGLSHFVIKLMDC